jgi:hypothetical protein
MTKKTFSKTLSANDVGIRCHQAGALIPKSETELLAFLPPLDPSVKNPDAWIDCADENGFMRRFRFVYYNNKLHDPGGTRNEYRITHMTSYFREMAAREGDIFEISKNRDSSYYTIKVIHLPKEPLKQESQQFYRIRIKSDWRKVH